MSAEWKYPFSQSSDPNVDLSSHDAFNEGAPYKTFERLRGEGGVTWTEETGGRGFWSVTSHEHITKLNRQPDLLSSAKGIRIEDQTEEEYEARKTFQETDPPAHTYFRMLVNKAFSRNSIAQFEDQIREITGSLIDKALEKGECDATEMIARQLPMRMLGQIIGVPEEDLGWLVEKGDALISNSDPDYTDFVVDKVDTDEYRLLPFRSPAAVELFDYANDLLKRMEAGESFGVLNLVLGETKGGTKMTHDEFRNFFCLLVAAGNDTTRYSIAASIHALANQPDLFQQVKDNLDDEAFMMTAADEMIRWASPTTHFRRTATRDFEHAGKQIKEGDKVVLWFASGNRDTEMFDDPYSIDLTRKPNRFMSFGQGGPHVCLGMWLAKLEVRIVLEELAKRVATIEQTANHSYLRSNFILGIKRLPVRMTAA
ncbi:cytochrome P450 [Kordiimonas marina]|uniref:cytochrome P450 n=1 Tax=Kordiimonas marina TaxID=2872312 RepID=UPI001FF238C7|nr:cytochrome P450 [Kordiimonas marina]MCJ9427963.1 cytochrome P450 [Kordiimonas marina]